MIHKTRTIFSLTGLLLSVALYVGLVAVDYGALRSIMRTFTKRQRRLTMAKQRAVFFLGAAALWAYADHVAFVFPV